MDSNDNELIAEFYYESKAWTVANRRRALSRVSGPNIHGGTDGFLEYHFDFDKDWNLLMPVVEKIDGIYHKTFPQNEEFIRRILAKEEPLDGPYMDVIALPVATPIAEVYEAVIKFIKWYNSQDSKPK